MAGYSGTPLVKKLGIKEGTRLFLSGAPKDYLKLVAPFPEGARVMPRIDGDTDIVHVFSTERARLTATLRDSLKKLKQDGTIWVSWPKKSSKNRFQK